MTLSIETAIQWVVSCDNNVSVQVVIIMSVFNLTIDTINRDSYSVSCKFIPYKEILAQWMINWSIVSNCWKRVYKLCITNNN